MFISICVCTYNRANILEYCLRSLGNLADIQSCHEVEVVVVDNNSNDDTAAVVKRVGKSIPFKVKYVFEPQQGISAARNRAIDESQGDYLAFLDDECVVPEKWLAIAVDDISQYGPKILGGPYVGEFFEGQKPQWYKAEYGNAYFLEWNLEKGFQSNFRASSGNMLVDRTVFDDLRFNINLGPIGNKIDVAEETELQERFLRANPSEQIFFDPNLVLQHLIRPEKMCLSYRARRLFAHELRSKSYHRRLPGRLLAAVRMLKVCLAAPIQCLLRDRKRYPFWQNYAYEIAIPSVTSYLGIVVRTSRKL